MISSNGLKKEARDVLKSLNISDTRKIMREFPKNFLEFFSSKNDMDNISEELAKNILSVFSKISEMYVNSDIKEESISDIVLMYEDSEGNMRTTSDFKLSGDVFVLEGGVEVSVKDLSVKVVKEQVLRNS